MQVREPQCQTLESGQEWAPWPVVPAMEVGAGVSAPVTGGTCVCAWKHYQLLL